MNPSKEWLMVCELVLAVERGNIDISENCESFLLGLYDNLDPYLSFEEQQSEKQKKWVTELWNAYHDHKSTEVNLEDF
jgi:hypothetical protein